MFRLRNQSLLSFLGSADATLNPPLPTALHEKVTTACLQRGEVEWLVTSFALARLADGFLLGCAKDSMGEHALWKSLTAAAAED